MTATARDPSLGASGVDDSRSTDDIYRETYPVLVRLAYVTVGSLAVAEELAQDAVVQWLRRKDARGLFTLIERPRAEGSGERSVEVSDCLRARICE